MMCRDVKDLIDVHVRGKLPKRQSRRIETHIDGCADCQQAEQDYRELQKQLKTLGPAECPDETVQSIYRRIGLREFGPWHHLGVTFSVRNRFRAAFAAAAVIVLTVGIWWQPARERPHTYTQKEIRMAYRQVRATIGRIGQISSMTRSIIEEDILIDEVLCPLSSGLNQALKPILNGDEL